MAALEWGRNSFHLCNQEFYWMAYLADICFPFAAQHWTLFLLHWPLLSTPPLHPSSIPQIPFYEIKLARSFQRELSERERVECYKTNSLISRKTIYMFAQEIKFAADQSGTQAKFLEYLRGDGRVKWGETVRGKVRPIETHGCQCTQRLCVFKERPAAEPPLDPSKPRKVSEVTQTHNSKCWGDWRL